MTWTEQAESILRECWAEGYSGNEISFELAAIDIYKSRNAIIGKAHRLGLVRENERALKSDLRYNPNGKSNRGRSKPKRKPAQPKIVDYNPVNTIPLKREAKPVPVRKDDAERVGIPMDQLTKHTCRWPVGKGTGADQRFCGCQIDPDACQPYCTEHMERSASQRTPEQREAISEATRRHHSKKRGIQQAIDREAA